MPSDSITITYNFSDTQLEENVEYKTVLNSREYYTSLYVTINLGSHPFIITPPTSAEATASFYNLQGMPIAHPPQRGMYIHR